MGGVAGLVDAVGGIEVCPKRNMVDKLAGLRIKKGCQEVDGATALAYARSRHTSGIGDIDRVRRQREVVSAVGEAVLSPWTILNPVRWWRLNHAIPEFFIFGEGMGPVTAGKWATAMTRVNGDTGLTCVVPLQDLAVHWHPELRPADVPEDHRGRHRVDRQEALLPDGRDRVTAYETLAVAVDDAGVATLTLSRPDQLNAFDLTMARELQEFFLTDARDDAVRAVVVTGAGRAFCAGMDLAAEGNVFGLDETMRPTPEELRADLDGVRRDPRHRRQGDPGDPRAAQAGHRGHQRSRGRHRRHDDPRHGPAARLDHGPDRLRLRPARHRPRGRVVLVPAADRRHPAGARVGLLRRDPRRRRRPGRAAGPLRCTSPTTSSRQRVALARSFVVDRSPVALGLAKQLLYRNSAAAEPLEAHLSDSLAMFWTSLGDGKEGVAAFKEKRTPHFTGRASDLPRIF